jgi:RNA polymerase sigma-70 factor (family 1)
MHFDQSENWNDLTLLQQLQRGEVSAFSSLYHQHSKTLYRKIVWMVNDEEVAKELLQDLFLKLWESREKIDLTKPFRSFLYTIAVNLVYDYFRKATKRKELESHILTLAVDYYTHVEEAMISKETLEMLNDVINQLPPQRKQIFVLCKVDGKSYDEVSEMLNISRSTIHDHIVKANRMIKDYLSKHPDILLYLLISVLFTV